MIAPFVVLALLPGIALTAVGIGASRGWPIVPGGGGCRRSCSGPSVFTWSASSAAPFSVHCSGCLAFVPEGRAGSTPGVLGDIGQADSFPSVQWIFRLFASIGARMPRRVAMAPVMADHCLGACVLLRDGCLSREEGRPRAARRDLRDGPRRPSAADELMAHRALVPKAENSAMVVAQALKLIPRSWPALPNIPNRPVPRTTAFEEALGRLWTMTENVRLDDSAADSIRTEMEGHAEAVRIARTVANYKHGRHELIIGPQVLDTSLAETQAAAHGVAATDGRRGDPGSRWRRRRSLIPAVPSSGSAGRSGMSRA